MFTYMTQHRLMRVRCFSIYIYVSTTPTGGTVMWNPDVPRCPPDDPRCPPELPQLANSLPRAQRASCELPELSQTRFTQLPVTDVLHLWSNEP